jgi:hypothetical protein
MSSAYPDPGTPSTSRKRSRDDETEEGEVEEIWAVIGGHTEIRRNRCNFRQLPDISEDSALKFDFPTVLRIVKDYWKLPPYLPKDLPEDYPPPAPLLDSPQDATTTEALQTAFTHNSVTYAAPGKKGNLILEFFGDLVMYDLVARVLREDSRDPTRRGVYDQLDQCGLDVSAWYILGTPTNPPLRFTTYLSSS